MIFLCRVNFVFSIYVLKSYGKFKIVLQFNIQCHYIFVHKKKIFYVFAVGVEHASFFRLIYIILWFNVHKCHICPFHLTNVHVRSISLAATSCCRRWPLLPSWREKLGCIHVCLFMNCSVITYHGCSSECEHVLQKTKQTNKQTNNIM